MAEIDLSTSRGQLLNLLRVFDPDPNDEYLQYAELAKRARGRLWGGPSGSPDAPWLPPGQGGIPPGQKPPGITLAEQRAALLAAVRFFGAEPDDARKSDEDLVARTEVLLDISVGRWTSRIVQPVGPTGDMSTTRPEV